MPKFLTFKSPMPKDLRENPIKALWESFQSLDQFTKGFLIVILLFLLATPFLVNNLQIFKPHAQEIEPTLGEQTPPIPPSVPDEILIKFKAGVNDKAKEKVRNEHGLTKLDEIKQIGVERVKVPADKKDQIIEALKHNPRVKYAEPNYLRQAQSIPNDTYFPNQWALAKINTPQAWDITQGNPSVVIAIIDSGININHEDLQGKYVTSPSPGIDDFGHGTQVAGVVAAATNNGKGIAGVCQLCTIMSIKVLSSAGAGSDSAIASGITTAADAGAKVINLSLGGYSDSQTIRSAVAYAWNKGVVVVAGAGNDGLTSPFYPAAIDVVLAVGMTSGADNKDPNSNYGSWLDVMAPGVSVYTTCLSGGYCFSSGTSISAPHVSGLAGLILFANPALTNQDVVKIITDTALDLGDPGWDQYYGYGRINACKALKAAVPNSTVICPTTSSSPTPAPSSFSSPSPTPTSTPIPTPIPDTTIPSVSITSPISGTTVSGSSVSFNVDATDNNGVTKVEFYADGVVLPNGTEVSSPYTASWDSTTYSNSSHTLSAKAYDNAGNIGTSSIVTVTVNNPTSTPTPTLVPPSPTPTKAPTVSSDTTPPTVIITNPLNGSTVAKGSTVTITASASDNIGITKVEFYISGSLTPKCTDTTPPYTCSSWKVPSKTNATYTLTAKAYDPSGNPGTGSVVVTGR